MIVKLKIKFLFSNAKMLRRLERASCLHF